MSTTVPQQAASQAAMDSAVRHLASTYAPKGNYIGILMLASLFVEAWDFYSIAFVLTFIREQYNPPVVLLGLSAAGVQAGALVGAVLGGWLTDKLGRRVMFIASIALFIVLALAQAFSTSVEMLLAIRFVLGIPLGADVTTGYTYIMEYLPTGRREVMGNRWQVMFAAGQVVCSIVVALFLVFGMSHELIWRVVLGLGAVPALIILLMRADLPETAIWLVRQGRFREAKVVSRRMYNDDLAMLPDADMVIRKPRVTEFLHDLRQDPLRWRAALYAWISFFCCGGQFSTFGFYIPVVFMMVGVSSLIGTSLMTGLIWFIAGIAAWVGPAVLPKLGHRGIGIWGFATVIVGLLLAAFALYTGRTLLLPFAAAIVMWGHIWAVTNPLTIATVVSRAQYRGIVGGVTYVFNKLTVFMGIFLFPSLFAAIGQANATVFVLIFPVTALLAAVFLFREVYGFQLD
ncbi:MAG TPA: MFS transporter [Rhodopila sp.]|uniref:MFS transporter n=1 Tax=Rhodopila sp. TaxID=2480087 RepID=UPI002C22F8E6|nr:MFS transporter [Rhodopila sp.]HVY14718.1 MFS transporter [Rhodopila sp.]